MYKNLKSWHIAFSGILFQILISLVIIFNAISIKGFDGLVSFLMGSSMLFFSFLCAIPVLLLFSKKQEK